MSSGKSLPFAILCLLLAAPAGVVSAPSLSADGRWISFGSISPDLHPEDCNGHEDVFLHDRQTGATDIASRHDPAAPSLAGAGRSLLGMDASPVSDDGHFAVFESDSGNLAGVDANGLRDVFLYDRASGTTELVSGSASSPDTAAKGESRSASISGNGRWIAFHSNAPDLVPGQGFGGANLFLYDRVTRNKTLVNHSASSPVTPGNGSAGASDLSGDGRYVAYSSTASNLVPGQTDPDFSDDVFVFDRTTGANTLVSRAAGSMAQASSGWEPRISTDGRYVAFVSNAHDLVPGPVEYPDTFSSHVYLHDRRQGTTVLVSRASSPAPRAGNATSSMPMVSADGRFVAFLSHATDLVPEQRDSNGGLDVFLYDRVLDSLTLVSHGAGTPAGAGNGVSSTFALSAEGTFVAFESLATNLIDGQVDGNGLRDVFLYDLRSGDVALVSHAAGSPDSAGDSISFRPAVSADGRVTFLSHAENLAGTAEPSTLNVFLYDPLSGSNRLLSTAAVAEPGFLAGEAGTAAISRNGLSVYFDTDEGDLVPGDHNLDEDVFADHTSEPATDFHALAPCRLLDTRAPGDGPALLAGDTELLAVHGACGIPPTARALAVNVTVVSPSAPGHITLHPAGLAPSATSTVNFGAGQTRSNNALVPLTLAARGLAVTPVLLGGGSVHVILDVNGWFE